MNLNARDAAAGVLLLALALLACFTSLTPGSTCLHVSDDRKRLYLHLLDGRNPEASIAKFRRVYERHLLELER